MNVIELFKNHEQVQEFSAGSTIFSQGEPSRLMYIVLSGSVNIVVRRQIVYTAVAGDVFGEMGIINDEEGLRSATAFVKSNCRVCTLDKAQLLEFIRETPEFALHVMRILADHVRRMNENALFYFNRS